MSFVAVVRVLLKPLIGLSSIIILFGVIITPGEIAKFNRGSCVSFITCRMLKMVTVSYRIFRLSYRIFQSKFVKGLYSDYYLFVDSWVFCPLFVIQKSVGGNIERGSFVELVVDSLLDMKILVNTNLKSKLVDICVRIFL